MNEVKKHPPMSEERRKRYRDLFENSQSIEGVAEHVKNHLIRMSEQGDGPVYFTLDCDALDATDNASNSAIGPFGKASI